MSTAQRTRPVTHGSHTQTITPTPSSATAGPSQQSNPPTGVLKLRGGPSRKAKVEWSEEVIDNEGLGRKKSKICCIYNKPRAFDESSSESSGSEDEAVAKEGKGKKKPDESESDGGRGDGRAR